MSNIFLGGVRARVKGRELGLGLGLRSSDKGIGLGLRLREG